VIKITVIDSVLPSLAAMGLRVKSCVSRHGARLALARYRALLPNRPRVARASLPAAPTAALRRRLLRSRKKIRHFGPLRTEDMQDSICWQTSTFTSYSFSNFLWTCGTVFYPDHRVLIPYLDRMHRV
jgi:hypothetical protein